MATYRVELNKNNCKTDSLILKLYTNKAFLLPVKKDNSFAFEVNSKNKKAKVVVEVAKVGEFLLAGDTTLSIFKDDLLIDKVRVDSFEAVKSKVVLKVNKEKLNIKH